jgi:hypothetical protein
MADKPLETWLLELQAMLESLLSHRDPDPSVCGAHAFELIAHEAHRHSSRLPRPRVRLELIDMLTHLSDDALADVRRRSIFYASQNLIDALSHRRFRGDAIACEEAMLYVQDRLQRDDFHRIERFDPTNGAHIKTYLWQIISRLLIDFARSRRHSAGNRDDEYATIEVEAGADAEASLVEQQLEDLLRSVFAEHRDESKSLHTLRERLREHICLTNHERLFLRALFQHDMSIEEIRVLPGFTMSSGDAWRFYYRLLDRLLEAFKKAGALTAMRTLLNAASPRLVLMLESGAVDIEPTAIHYVKAVAGGSSCCHASSQGRIVFGHIEDSFARLKKKLAPWFSPVNATTLVADRWLAAIGEHWSDDAFQVVQIPEIAESFPLGRTQRAALRERYAKKRASHSYMNPEDAVEQTRIEARRP